MCLLFSVFYFSYGQLDWTLSFLIGRETRSAFSYEYSYSSLILVEYSYLAIAMLLAPVLHASLIQSC
jgi:hypothetical protein